MSALTSVAVGLAGAARLAFGKADGAVLVPGDRRTAVRSFWAIAFAVPSVLCRLLMAWAVEGFPTDPGHQIGRELITFVVGWLLFVEATHRIAPLLGRAQRWPRFIALWNWCNVVEGVLVVLGALPDLMGAPPVVGQASVLITIGWALWLEWYATRLTLDVGIGVAIGFVALDQAIGVLLGVVAISLGG